MALLTVSEKGRTDTVSWNLIAVLNQASAKLLFMVRSYATPSD